MTEKGSMAEKARLAGKAGMSGKAGMAGKGRTGGKKARHLASGSNFASPAAWRRVLPAHREKSGGMAQGHSGAQGKARRHGAGQGHSDPEAKNPSSCLSGGRGRKDKRRKDRFFASIRMTEKGRNYGKRQHGGGKACYFWHIFCLNCAMSL
jgi:hypothetical protein